MSGALGAAADAVLRDALGPDGAPLLRFARAVVWQAAHPLGAAESRDHDVASGGALPDVAAVREARELATARRLATVLAAAVTARAPHADPTAFEHAAATLARDVTLVSACYQNLDLVPPGAAGDAVAMLVGRAVEGLEA